MYGCIICVGSISDVSVASTCSPKCNDFERTLSVTRHIPRRGPRIRFSPRANACAPENDIKPSRKKGLYDASGDDTTIEKKGKKTRGKGGKEGERGASRE